MIALVESTKEDDHIGLTGLLHSLSDEFIGRAQIIERTAYCDAIVTLDGVAHVTTSKVDLNTFEAIADAVERKDLLLHLQRGGASAYGHHFNGILAHHEDTFGLLQR